MPRAAQQAFGVVSTALNDTTGTPRDPRRPAPTAPPPSRTHPPHSTTVSLADRPPPSPLPSFRSGVTAPLVSHLHRIRDLDARSTAIVDGVKRKVETRLEATRSGEGDPSSKRTRASGDASSSGASVPSANEREVRDACTDALNVADEKVALAQAAYDLIDAHITKLDRDLRTFDQALLEREAAAAAAAGIKPSTPGTGGGAGVKPDGDTGGGGGGVTNGGGPAAESNEPRYCVCQRVSLFPYGYRMGNWTDVVFCVQVSFGAMIGCDNEQCDVEWFHYSCVGLSTEAKFKGNWYCPACTAERRRLKKLEAKEAAANAKK